MTEADRRERPAWQPPPLWASIVGAATVAPVHAGLVVLLAWAADPVPGVPDWRFTHLLETGVIIWVGATLVTTGVRRHFMRRAGRDSPGGVLHVVVDVSLTALAGALAGAISLPGRHAGLIIGLCTLTVCGLSAVLMQEWKPGMTTEEFREKWDELKDMTADHFADDVESIRQQARAQMREKWERQQERERRRDS